MCPLSKINKRAKHIVTVRKLNGYNSIKEAGKTKPGSMLVNSGCLLNFHSLIWKIKCRTSLKSSDSGLDIKGFNSVLTVALLLTPLDTNDFRMIHD